MTWWRRPPADAITGVPAILDADTVVIAGTHVRLQGIDAPEMDQVCLDAEGARWACGVAARAALAAFAGGQAWSCALAPLPDRYGRRLGTCRVGSDDINDWLARQGWAIAYRHYSMAYAAAEDEARDDRRGLWDGAFRAPWDWRHRTCDTPILGPVAVPVDARASLCKP